MSREWCLAMTFCCVDLPFRSHTRAGWMRGAIDQRGSAMSSRCAHAPERQAKAGSCRLPLVDLIAMQALGQMPISGHSQGPAIDP